jgi:hypothetical protein
MPSPLTSVVCPVDLAGRRIAERLRDLPSKEGELCPNCVVVERENRGPLRGRLAAFRIRGKQRMCVHTHTRSNINLRPNFTVCSQIYVLAVACWDPPKPCDLPCGELSENSRPGVCFGACLRTKNAPERDAFFHRGCPAFFAESKDKSRSTFCLAADKSK